MSVICDRLPFVSYDQLSSLRGSYPEIFKLEYNKPFKMRKAWNKGVQRVGLRKNIELAPLRKQKFILKLFNKRFRIGANSLKTTIYKKASVSRVKEKRYIGVTVYHSQKFTSKPYSAYISKYSLGNKKQRHIGNFSDYHEAAEAYNNAVTRLELPCKLNAIDRNLSVPKRYLQKIQKMPPPVQNMVSLNVPQSIQLIKSNTNQYNSEDNKALIMYLSGRKSAIETITKKYFPYWNSVVFKLARENRLKGSLKKFKFSEFPFTHEDVTSESILRMLNACSRGKFDGRKFKQWSTQVLRNQFREMCRKEIKRRVETPKKNKIQDFDYEVAWANM